MPKFSIIICTHNRAELVSNLVLSFNDQEKVNYEDTEIIVVASGCIDNTVSSVKSLEDRINAKLVVIDESEPGLSLARNRGLAVARHEIIAFLDDDIRLRLGWAKGILDAFETQKCHIVGGRILLWWDNVSAPSWIHHYHRRLLGYNEHGEQIKKVDPGNIFGGNFAISRDVYQKVGEFSTNLGRRAGERLAGEEADYFMRARTNGFNFIYTPFATVEHLVNESRATIEYLTNSAYGVGQTRVLLPDRISKIDIKLIYEKLELLLNETQAEEQSRGKDVQQYMFHKTRRFDLLGECIGTLKFLFGDIPEAKLTPHGKLDIGILVAKLTKHREDLAKSIDIIKEPTPEPRTALKNISPSTNLSSAAKLGAIPDKKCRISLIIPVYNAEDLISKALTSIVDQTLHQEAFETICVDDCSTDRTVEVIRTFADKIKNLHVITLSKNKKQGAARNIGLAAAAAPYVFFLDADDYLEKHALDTLIRHSQGRDLLVTQHKTVSLRGSSLDTLSKRTINSSPFMAALNGAMGWWPFGLLISRDLLVNHRIRFRERVYFEDIDFVCRVARAAKSWCVLSDHIYNYVAHEKSTVNSLNDKKLVDSVEAVRCVFQMLNDSGEDRQNWSSSASRWLLHQCKRIQTQNAEKQDQLRLVDILYGEISANRLWKDLDMLLHSQIMACLGMDTDIGPPVTRIPAETRGARLRLANHFFRAGAYSIAESNYRALLDNAPRLNSIKFNISRCEKLNRSTLVSPMSYNRATPREIDYLFIPHNHYHARTFVNISKRLMERGIVCGILRVSPPHPDEGAYIFGERRHYIQLRDFCEGYILPRAVACMNDWEPKIAGGTVEWANRHGIATYGIVEGVNDFRDVDTGLNRRAYQRVKNLFLNGNFDRKYFDSNRQRIAVVGIERLDELFVLKKSASLLKRARRVVVNCNFTYGVLADKASQWVNDVSEAARRSELDLLISKHPEDHTDVGTGKVSGRSLYDELIDCEIFITRFSGALFEALVAGCKVVYFNPGIENIDKFIDPMGAFLYARTLDELWQALESIKRGWQPRTAEFLQLHVDSSYSGDIVMPSALDKVVSYFVHDAPVNAAKMAKDRTGGHVYFDDNFFRWFRVMADSSL